MVFGDTLIVSTGQDLSLFFSSCGTAVGLQLFIAAPDDAEAKLRQVADTVLYFLREGPIASIDTDFVTPAARQLLAGISSTENSISV